jgi:protein-tyrosine phosphatase
MSVKVLMVCLGNICRSPLAEGILQAKLPNNYFVDSAGTANYHVGSAPDKRSIVTAKKFGIDISQQKCRQISLSDFEAFDYIYVMDASNYKNVVAIAPNEKARQKVKIILNELHPNKNAEVPDPYYGDLLGFEDVYKILDEVCESIAIKIKS